MNFDYLQAGALGIVAYLLIQSQRVHADTMRGLIREFIEALHALDTRLALIEDAISDNCPQSVQEGGEQ